MYLIVAYYGVLCYNYYGGVVMYFLIRKTKNKELMYIEKSYRRNGISTSKNVEKLGDINEYMKTHNMSRDEVIAWGKKRALELTGKEKQDSKDIIVSLSQSSIIDKNKTRLYKAGYLFIQDLYYQLRFDNTFRNIKSKYGFEYDIDSIFSDLIYSRIIDPGSKLSSYETVKSFLETPKYELHDVYRALSILAKEMNYIQSEIYKNSNLLVKRNNKVLYYDCSNYYFETEDEDDFRKYGKSKEHRPNPIVQMGLFMDGDGIPLAFSIFEGNSNEQKSLKPLEEMIIKDYEFESFVVCTDAGLASKTNKLFNSIQDRAYIITQSIKKLNKEYKDFIFTDTNWKRVSDNKKVKLEDIKLLTDDEELYYKEIPFKDDEISNQRLIVTYSPVYARYQKNIRDKQIIRAGKIIEAGKLRKARNENDPHRFIKVINTTETGEIADNSVLILDDSIIDQEASCDGLYALTTNLEDNIANIMKVAKGRWEIEESFRIMKTDFKARPVYLQRQDRIKAHFLTCYTALLILRLLEKKTKDKYTTEQLIDTLRNYNLLKLDEGYIPAYTRNDITDNLHNVFGFRTDYQIITPSRIRNIIKNTKKK